MHTIELADFERFFNVHGPLSQKYILPSLFIFVTGDLQDPVHFVFPCVGKDWKPELVVPHWMLATLRIDFGSFLQTRKGRLGVGILFVKRWLVEMLSFQYNDNESANLLLLGHDRLSHSLGPASQI